MRTDSLVRWHGPAITLASVAVCGVMWLAGVHLFVVGLGSTGIILGVGGLIREIREGQRTND